MAETAEERVRAMKEEGSSRDHAQTIGSALEWRTIDSAPKDGTPILAWCVHPNARFAGDAKEWAAAVVTQWISHNGGGWTWYGMTGEFTHWMPLPPPPEDGAADGAQRQDGQLRDELETLLARVERLEGVIEEAGRLAAEAKSVLPVDGDGRTREARMILRAIEAEAKAALSPNPEGRS